MENANREYEAAWNQAMTSGAYDTLVDTLVEERKTSGPQPEHQALVEFTKLNQARIRRIRKTVKVDDRLLTTCNDLSDRVGVIVITEAWCGDAAQSVPVLQSICEASGLALRIALRDENDWLMSQHLTNGSRSIPIFVFLELNTWRVLATWGPRPSELQKEVVAFYSQSRDEKEKSEFKAGIQKWYNTDRQRSIQRELLDIARSIHT